MTARPRRSQHRLRIGGIICLILASVHAPWPQADYHNVRHHDAPGEFCELHDHLLRWHPDAGLADDVAVLHWHWILAGADWGGPASPASGPVVHCDVPDWDLATSDTGLLIKPDLTSRPPEPPSPRPLCSIDEMRTARSIVSGRAMAPDRPTRLVRGRFDASWLQRWVC